MKLFLIGLMCGAMFGFMIGALFNVGTRGDNHVDSDM